LPETGVVPRVKVNVAVVIVAGSIASLKVAAIFLLIGTPIAPSVGLVELTVGALLCGHPPKTTINAAHPKTTTPDLSAPSANISLILSLLFPPVFLSSIRHQGLMPGFPDDACRIPQFRPTAANSYELFNHTHVKVG
jgi:hypothetical protein